MYIGNKMKELRNLQGMTLSQLAEKSSVQIATLSRMEHMKMTGTIESHIQIAKALGVDITQLYADIVEDEKRIDLKTKKSSTDVFVHSNKSSYEILTNKVLSKKMMPILLKIEANGKTNDEQNTIGSEKFIFVLDGKIEIKIQNKISGEKNTETYSLSKNNTLYFDASLKHCIFNKGEKTARIICVTTPVAL